MSIANNAIGNFTVKEVLTLNSTETIGYAVDQMIKHRFRRFPVLDKEKNLFGIITATDVVRELYNKGTVDIFKEKLETIITKDPSTLVASDTIQSAIKLMYESGISGLPIMQSNNMIGLFTEKDIIMLDDLWFSLPDGMITHDEGIGRVIDSDHMITEDFTLWQAIDKMIQLGQRQILIQNREGTQLLGLLTVLRLLEFIFSQLIIDDREISILHNTSVGELPNFPVLQKSTPVLVNSVRLWMNARGIEAVPLFHMGKPVKLVTEKDLVAFIVNQL
ncbi:MAG: Inosine-5'-monophosphate dehydrogenase [Candidatus Heimdallarchaeota archaeon LC_2]|nr:MAG: Inosine-5'-monophosphate dehydrogenase [Candidatus Heimdallarchaeota archaeon LC_2]